MDSINNDLNTNNINSEINYSIKSCKIDEFSALNDFSDPFSAYMFSNKSQYNRSIYPEFRSLQKNHQDYLSLFDINKVDLISSIKNDRHKRHSGYFDMIDVSKHLKSVNEDLSYKPFISRITADINNENNNINNNSIKIDEKLKQVKADSSVSETSLAETCVRKLSFGKSPDQTHVKLADLNETNSSSSNNHNNHNKSTDQSYNDHEVSAINKKSNNHSVNESSTSNNSNTNNKDETDKASPLFLKIMSKLSELPDSMLFSTTNNNNDSENINNITINSVNDSLNNISNERNSTDSKMASSNLNVSSNTESQSQSNSKQQQPGVRLSEKVLKSLNKRNIVIVRRPTAPAPAPPQLVAKQNRPIVSSSNNNNRDKLLTHPENSLQQKQQQQQQLQQKSSMNVLQRNCMKLNEKRVKYRSMYVDSELCKKEYALEADLSSKRSEKYASHLIEGLNVISNKSDNNNNNSKDDENSKSYIEFRKNLLKDLECEKKKSSSSSKRSEEKSNLNQIEESLKCFSYLDNLDDSLSLEETSHKLTEKLASTIESQNKKKHESNYELNKLSKPSSNVNKNKEVTSLTIHTPTSINYNIRMNTDSRHQDESSRKSEEPSIKLRAKNNELTASINIMEASLTNNNTAKTHIKNETNKKQSNRNSNSILDEKIEEIEKTANFDLSSNESETESSYDNRKSNKKSITIKKVKTEQSSHKKYDHIQIDSTNTAKITNNYTSNNNNNNNILIVNNTNQKTSKKSNKIVDIHLLEKPKTSEHEKDKEREKTRVKVPVIHTTHLVSSNTTTRPTSNIIEHIENEKNKSRMIKKHSSDKEKSQTSTASEKSKIVIKKPSSLEEAKYHAELNLKRFNGIVANCIDPKLIAKTMERSLFLTERPKTTVPMDTTSSQNSAFLRKISTPPPLPNILDKLDMLNSPKVISTFNNHHSTNNNNNNNHHHHHNHSHNHHHNNYHDKNLDHEIKIINSNLEAKNNLPTSTRPVSITSSIRSGKSEKPLRLNHGLPPPPALNLKQEIQSLKYNLTQSTQQTSQSSKKSSDFNNKKILPLTSNLISKLKLTDSTTNKKSTTESDTHKETKHRISDISEDSKREKPKTQQVTIKKTTEKPVSTTTTTTTTTTNTTTTTQSNKKTEDEQKPKTNVKTLVLNGMTTNIPVDENFGGRCTNLPQLGAIDYIYKTSDDRYMTSQSPFSYDKKQKSKDMDKQGKSSSETPTSTKKTTTTNNQKQPHHQQQYNNDDLIEKFDSSLPWTSKDMKNGKNFYENYARENDRRKKEGNGFLMLLPGIAIPIDTDANDSDEDATSDSLD